MESREVRASFTRSEHTTGSPKERLSFTGVEKTVIPMVFFRAMDAKLPEPILGDPYSQGILDSCEIDLKEDHFIRDDQFIEYVMNRTKHLDIWCRVCSNPSSNHHISHQASQCQKPTQKNLTSHFILGIPKFAQRRTYHSLASRLRPRL